MSKEFKKVPGMSCYHCGFEGADMIHFNPANLHGGDDDSAYSCRQCWGTVTSLDIDPLQQTINYGVNLIVVAIERLKSGGADE